MASAADVIVVPTARGDLLWGIYRELAEAVQLERLSNMPKLLTVEPFPRLERVLEGEDIRSHFPGKSLLVSIGGATVTYQSYAAITGSAGTMRTLRQCTLSNRGWARKMSRFQSVAESRLQEQSRKPLKPICIRKSQYLNNRIEQDHRRVKRRARSMLGFKSIDAANIILSDIEMVHIMRKRQARFAYNPNPSVAEQFKILARLPAS